MVTAAICSETYGEGTSVSDERKRTICIAEEEEEEEEEEESWYR
jgi:hypothetical protein